MFQVTVNAGVMTMLRLVSMLEKMIALAMKMMFHLLVMISTVETTHIGARSPGPDTEVGICSDALQKNEYNQNIVNCQDSEISRVGETISILAGPTEYG